MALQAKTLVRITGILIFLWLSAVNLAMAEEGTGDSGSTGSFDINKESVIIEKGGTYTITGGEQTGNTITVNLGSKEDVANITIEGVDILKTGYMECPFNIIKGTVNLTLAGKDDKLQAGRNCAALQVSQDSKLVITEKSKGKLTAIGGDGGAGIGGGRNSDAGFITIAGGTVEARGGVLGAGIGGGDSGAIGSITIAGGTVVAKGGLDGAGIGGSYRSNAGSITIAGGTVVATGGDEGAGIGGGYCSTDVSITISGGTVDATEGDYGAGIGGGYDSRDVSITISGGKVTTEGNIGDGEDSSGANGTISGGTIVCKSISPALSISGGSVRTKDNSVMSDGKGMAVVKGLPKGEVTSITIDRDGSYGVKDVCIGDDGLLFLYIPKGKPVSLSLRIGSEEYTATYVVTSEIYNSSEPKANASLIQKAGSPGRVLTRDQNGGTIEFQEGNWIDQPSKGSNVNLKVKTQPGFYLNYDKLKGITKKDLTVNLTGRVSDGGLTYTISFTMPDKDVCIRLFDNLSVETEGGAYTKTFNQLTITKAGEYHLKGKGAFAFLSDEEKSEIKMSDYASDFCIDIEDGVGVVTLHLDGVSFKLKKEDLPALSCGKGNTVKVVLDGDNYLEGGDNAAGINKGPDEKGSLTIEGPGRLEAKGGWWAAGIGGNDSDQAKNITIAGGTIVATGGDGAPGIGSGYYADEATNISITGGSVNATVEGIIGQTKTEVSFPAMPGGKVVETSGLDGYGLMDMNLYPKGTPSTATLYLWLPDSYTNKEITINGYSGKVTAGSSVTLTGTITISDPVTYNESDHKNKSITITSTGTFTIDASNASVIDLTIEPGGKLLTKQQLKVKGEFTVEPNTILDKWITFCSPVPLKLFNQSWAAVSDPLGGPSLKSGFTTANDQEWTFEQSIKENTPYLIKVPSGIVNPVLYAQNVKLLVNKDISINPPSGFDNNLLFCANTSLTEQKLTNIYVLDKYNERQAIVLKSNYTLQPFEAYFIASPASPTTPAIESQGEPGKMTSPELRAAPDDIIMPQKLTLKQPNSGKGSFTVTEDKNGQVAYGFALKDAKVTLELKPKTKDGYSVENTLIKVYETNDPNTTAITLSGAGNTRTFTMPNAPVTIEVEFMKTLTIKPDEGQVVYEDENDYHPTYTVKGITEADGNVVFTGNLKVGEDNKIVNDNLSAGDAYKIEVKEGVTVERLSGNASDVVKKPLELCEQVNGNNGWYKGLKSVTLVAPRGFSIKQTPATPAPASLSLRDAADADGYTDMLTFTEQGEHTVYYSLKRDGMDKKVYDGKSITYKLDTEAPTYIIKQDGENQPTEVKLIDDISGMASYSYKLGDNAEETIIVDPILNEASFLLYGLAGTYDLLLTMTDVAGNKNTVKTTVEFKYDNKYKDEGGNGGGGDNEEGGNDDDNNGGGNDNNNDNNGGDNGGDNDNDKPVANEAIQAPAYGIYVENSKLCIEASQPCQVSIYNYQGSVVMIRQIPSGKTRLYELPVGQYIVCLSAPYLPQGKVTQKVRVN